MTDDGKKVSFGFSKSIKKSALKIKPPKEEKKVDYIECVDDKCIKVVGEEKKVDGPLVIPLLGSKTWHDRILNKTDADIFESKAIDTKSKIKNEIVNGNTEVNDNGTLPMDISKIKKEDPDVTENVPKTLEEQAASEIIADLHGTNIKVEDPTLKVGTVENGTLHGREESSLEDYEQIPIDVFGLAMLRGMGWKPEEGIGKNAKLVTATLPELRPRGMGLGADKAVLQKPKGSSKSKEEEQLKVEKGSFVKIIAGKHTNNYGQIEDYDVEAGRLIVKMALSGESQSLTEYLVRPVTKTEFAKNSKVLNAAKYEEFKNKGSNKERDGTSAATFGGETIDDESTKKRREDRARSSKGTKKTEKPSDESTDSDRRRRKRHSSKSDEDGGRKRVKKSKKRHKRDSSAERTRKKSKKRDKDRTRGRMNECSESPDHKKHKKHKRTRSSSSPNRR